MDLKTDKDSEEFKHSQQSELAPTTPEKQHDGEQQIDKSGDIGSIEPHFDNFLQENQHVAHSPGPKPENILAPPQIVEETPVSVSQMTQTDSSKPISNKMSLGNEELGIASNQQPVEPILKQDPVGRPEEPNDSLDVEKDENQQSPPIPTGVIPQRPRKLSELMTLAFKQRKDINRNDFIGLSKKRTQYYEKHASVYDNASFQLLQKIKETNEYVPSIVKFLNQLGETYKSFHDHFRKMTAFKFLLEPLDPKKTPDNRLNWSMEMNKGIKGVMELRDETSQKMKEMQQSISQVLINNVERSVNQYNKRVESMHKLSEKQKGRFHDAQQEVGKKVKKVIKLLSEEQQEGKDKKDSLASELQTFSQFKKSKHQLRQWGNHLLNWWNQTISAEIVLVNDIRNSMLSFLSYFRQIHGISDKLQGCEKYWRQINVNSDIHNKLRIENILPMAQYDFLKMTLISLYGHSGKELQFKDLLQFNSLQAEEKYFGEPRNIINSLIIKKFECGILEGDHVKTKATAVSTVDEFLVLIEEKQLSCLNKMQLKRLMNTRKTEYQVSVNEKIEGFIMDSWNKQTLHFKNSDCAEEFMFFTENNQEVKEGYSK